MSTRLENIVYELGDYWVLKVPTGYEVYRVGVTHSTRCARIGFKGDKGLERAKQECDRRIAKEAKT